ncbi:MFS general substrate transporter [Aspergillus floccosus]
MSGKADNGATSICVRDVPGNKTEPGTEEPSIEYSIFPERQKIFFMMIATTVNFLAPTTATIYYPALLPLSKDLDVPATSLNLSIVTYMIAEGVVPLLTGRVSDRQGRRPVLIVCLLLYLGANVGLAVQGSFAALLALRCLQSFGTSGAAVVASAVTSDLITRAERGKYIAYTSLGFTVGPALGPILGGILAQFLGWRSIFWFLVILTGVLLCLIILLLPESSRSLVDNGSVPPQNWNRPLVDMVHSHASKGPSSSRSPSVAGLWLGILATVKVVLDREPRLLIFSLTLFFCGCMAVLTTMPALLEETYSMNALQVGLCYIPYAVGGLASRWAFGALADWNFRRHAHKAGVEVQRNRQTARQLRAIPMEKARLEPIIPLVCCSCLCVLGYAWTMDYQTHLSGPLILLFLLGMSTAGVTNMTTALLLDVQGHQPGTAFAALFAFRFLVGAGVVAGSLPLAHRIGVGWMGTVVAGIWFLITPVLGMIYLYGHGWRTEVPLVLAGGSSVPQTTENAPESLTGHKVEA